MIDPWSITAAVFLIIFAALILLSPGSRFNISRRRTEVLALAISVFIFLCLLFYNFIVDDVYISLRFARNLADGYGLVFNTDDNSPVEGYTNFLWVLMESFFFMLPMSDNDILHSVRMLGITFGAGCLIMTYLITRLVTGDIRTSLIAVIFMAAVPEFAFWSVGGLETSMYIFWVLTGLYLYILEKRNNRLHIASMSCLVLAALTRPEGLFLGVILIIWDLINLLVYYRKENPERKRRIMQAVSALLTFGLLYGIYFSWRFGYYGHFFPNTYYAKKISSLDDLIHRFKQMSAFVVRMFPFFSLACLGYCQFRQTKAKEKVLLLVMMIILLGFSYASRNEWMPGYRYELPFLPILMIFCAAGINRVLFIRLSRNGVNIPLPAIRFSALLFLLLFQAYPFYSLRKKGNEFGYNLNRAHVPLGKWLKKHAPPDASYASWDMGAVPYYSGLPHIIDINSEGLLNSYTTRHGYNVEHLMSSNPSFIVLPSNTSNVRPRDILEFYNHNKFVNEYVFLFSLEFEKDYDLNVYMRRNVDLHDLALDEGHRIANESRYILH